MNPSKSASAQPRRHYFWIVSICLVVILGILFHKSFEPNMVVHSNDGPLGSIMSKSSSLPGTYSGYWQDLNWIGGAQPSAMPSISVTLNLLLKPFWFAKLYPMIALLILGLSAWFFFRQLKFAPIACILGGLAAALSSDYFSIACWGVAAQPIAFAMNFLALGAIANDSTRPWIKTILAGLAVGMGVMEGFDNGAIFSLFVAAYVLFDSWNRENGTAATKKLGRGVLRVAVIALFAGFIATQTLYVLINTQIKGVAGIQQQDEQSRKQRWAEATQWSLPKAEVLQIIIPGVFGYRMDTPGGGAYWGTVGKAPYLDQIEEMAATNPQAAQYLKSGGLMWRFSGGGIYAGVLVVVVACWAAFQSLRKKNSAFSLFQRRAIWFWIIAAIISLLLAFGRFAPFYKLFYALPYASTIRNPAKFIHVFNFALLIIFAYGVDGIYRTYMQNAATRISGILPQFKNWLSKAAPFERKFMFGCFIVLGAGLLGWLIYASNASDLEAHIRSIGFDPQINQVSPNTAHEMALFSIRSVGWFILFLILSIISLGLIFSGQFSGSRSKWGAWLLGLIVVIDLGRASLPWIIYWDVTDKYATNPVIETLRNKPWEHRVTMLPALTDDPHYSILGNIYGLEWTQHLFLYNNIQSVDRVQEPRVSVENEAYRRTLIADQQRPKLNELLREWELTNTRYLLGPYKLGGQDFVELLNAQIGQGKPMFRVVQPFDIVPKPGRESVSKASDLTAATNGNGAFAIIEYLNALPRAQLYSKWQVVADNDAALQMLTNSAFNPHETVIVSNPIPAPTAPGQPAGSVQIKDNYEPKRVELDAEVKVPSVLLLNDKYDPDWKLHVDGKPETILRANYIMRGVYLQPGHHTLVFTYEPNFGVFYVSLAAVILGLLLVGFLSFTQPKAEARSEEKGSAQEKVSVQKARK
jgi:Bacterial membrane protein YfhO